MCHSWLVRAADEVNCGATEQAERSTRLSSWSLGAVDSFGCPVQG